MVVAVAVAVAVAMAVAVAVSVAVAVAVAESDPKRGTTKSEIGAKMRQGREPRWPSMRQGLNHDVPSLLPKVLQNSRT